METLVVATGNPGKVKELQDYLQPLNLTLVLKPQDLEIEETGTTFMENARLKASQVAAALEMWAIADDSGLMVDALGGAPGIYSARYGDTSEDGIDRVLTELGDTDQRQAQFVCAVAIARPDGTIALESEGICRGEILRTRQGQGGFGYDPIFYVPAENQTFAEMPLETKQAIGHRGQALQALLPALRVLIGEV
ncbi:MAG: RdgB/HAM1 family non-canonical purine NTP pyrophosphatase [Synechococcales bacterium]|nr:RdgB/HAM1 family non-canonical purine NTP pyrophosphatase [Synechococcales bacterium]